MYAKKKKSKTPSLKQPGANLNPRFSGRSAVDRRGLHGHDKGGKGGGFGGAMGGGKK